MIFKNFPTILNLTYEPYHETFGEGYYARTKKRNICVKKSI